MRMAFPALTFLFGSQAGDGESRSRRRGKGREGAAGLEPVRPAMVVDPRLERIRCGDQTVLAELYDAHFRDLAELAFRFVGEKGVAQDVVHDVFLRVWSMRATLDVHTRLEAYLFGAVANRARNVVAQRRRDHTVLGLSSDDRETAMVESVPSRAASPYDDLETGDVRAAVMSAVAALPERQRLALTLRLTKDMTYDEIGVVLGITKASVAELVRKAQAHLRLALKTLLS